MNDVLNKVTEAVHRYLQEGTRGIDWVLMHMSADERVRFDLHLVKVKHRLAYQAGRRS